MQWFFSGWSLRKRSDPVVKDEVTPKLHEFDSEGGCNPRKIWQNKTWENSVDAATDSKSGSLQKTLGWAVAVVKTTNLQCGRKINLRLRQPDATLSCAFQDRKWGSRFCSVDCSWHCQCIQDVWNKDFPRQWTKRHEMSLKTVAFEMERNSNKDNEISFKGRHLPHYLLCLSVEAVLEPGQGQCAAQNLLWDLLSTGTFL